MRRRTTLLLIALGMVVALGLAQEVVEEIVAIVNDEVITLSQYKREYDSRVLAARAQLQGAEFDKFLETLKPGLMDALITDMLLLQMAKEKNYNVADQVKTTIENVKKENNISNDDELKRALQAQGLEWETWLKQLEETIMQRIVVDTEVNRSIVLDDAEIVDFYKKHQPEFVEPEEYKIRAVYLNAVDAADAALETKKKEIDDKIKAGGNFEEISGTSSDDPVKESKGDLGTMKKGQLDPTLQQALDKMKMGEVSPWVKAKNGWYLLKMEDKKDSRLLAFEEARKAIENRLFGEKQAVKLNEFLANLKKKSYIKILKPNPLGVDK
ncbi:MAG: peptidyl-prolyl cis-trans isomerase [Candidatus Aminicenantes bacterium]|nr:peptidyl-prolyl cis-trans isomerase [Candidatus Aminicenantes bacterium]